MVVPVVWPMTCSWRAIQLNSRQEEKHYNRAFPVERLAETTIRPRPVLSTRVSISHKYLLGFAIRRCYAKCIQILKPK